jgi:hypothetical protein
VPAWVVTDAYGKTSFRDSGRRAGVLSLIAAAMTGASAASRPPADDKRPAPAPSRRA